jgi:hypothetical protein
MMNDFKESIDELSCTLHTVNIEDKGLATDEDLCHVDAVGSNSWDIGVHRIRGDSFVVAFDIACRKRRSEFLEHDRADINVAIKLSGVGKRLLDGVGRDIEELRA